MEALIRQAFLHIDVVGPQVANGHYDLLGPNEEIILPSVWERTIEPGWSIEMKIWPMQEPPPKRRQFPPRPHRHGPPPRGPPPPIWLMPSTGPPPGPPPPPRAPVITSQPERAPETIEEIRSRNRGYQRKEYDSVAPPPPPPPPVIFEKPKFSSNPRLQPEPVTKLSGPKLGSTVKGEQKAGPSGQQAENSRSNRDPKTRSWSPLIQEDPLNVQQTILNYLTLSSRSPVTSVYDLATLITNSCANVFDQHRIPDEFQFLDFFEHSIGVVVRLV